MSYYDKHIGIEVNLAEGADVPDFLTDQPPPGPNCRFIDGGWVSLEPVSFSGLVVPPAAAAAKVSPVEFKLLFTAPERVAIKLARQTDPVIDDFYDIIEDPRLTHVDLGMQSTRDAIAYIEDQGLIAAGRSEQILSGVLL